MSNDQIEIFEVPEFLGNAYILQTEGDYLEALYSAPRFWERNYRPSKLGASGRSGRI